VQKWKLQTNKIDLLLHEEKMFWRVSKERIVGRLMLSDVVVEQ
jgi:hypothetical protein